MTTSRKSSIICKLTCFTTTEHELYKCFLKLSLQVTYSQSQNFFLKIEQMLVWGVEHKSMTQALLCNGSQHQGRHSRGGTHSPYTWAKSPPFKSTINLSLATGTKNPCVHRHPIEQNTEITFADLQKHENTEKAIAQGSYTSAH